MKRYAIDYVKMASFFAFSNTAISACVFFYIMTYYTDYSPEVISIGFYTGLSGAALAGYGMFRAGQPIIHEIREEQDLNDNRYRL